MTNFDIWDQSVHDLVDQKKRVIRAKSGETSPIEIDRENCTGIFWSSGKNPYITTFDSCTCIDNQRRKLPCKHMYRLAMECGQFDGSYISGLNINCQVSLYEAIVEIEKLTEKNQKIIEYMLHETINETR